METIPGKVCLITDGTNGIGKATAQALAQLGATVLIVVMVFVQFPAGVRRHE
jgi:NAD(P)-dependent dehydrogenase (short-subunit alcohol dehydrogenase family)